MATRTALQITAGSLAGLALFSGGLALGQHPAPTDYRGVTEAVLAVIDLGKEVDSVENRELRVSRATAPSTWRALPRLRDEIGVSSRVG